MIIFIYGEDSFRSHQYLKEQIEKFKKTRDPQGYNVVSLEATKELAGKILTEIFSAPFLSERRMIIVNNVLSTSDKEFLSNLIKKIKEKNIPESNVTVFWQATPLSKIKETKELFDLLVQEKYVQKFDLLKGTKLSAWIEQEVSRRGGKIDRKAAEYIVEHSTEDMWHINSALDQMVAFKKTEPITAKDVGWFVSEQAEESVFKIVEAIVGSNGKQAYKLLTEQSSNFDGGYLLGLLIWQLRILIEMRDLFEREDNVTSNELAKKLKINPYVAKKNLALVKQQPLFKLKHSYQELLEIDRKIKTGQLDQSLVVDMCILKLS